MERLSAWLDTQEGMITGGIVAGVLLILYFWFFDLVRRARVLIAGTTG